MWFKFLKINMNACHIKVTFDELVLPSHFMSYCKYMNSIFSYQLSFYNIVLYTIELLIPELFHCPYNKKCIYKRCVYMIYYKYSL